MAARRYFSVRSRFGICAMATLGLAVISSEASAASYCDVLHTKDGFVALRAGPSVDSQLVQRLLPGQQVGLDPLGKDIGKWTAVYFRPDRGKPITTTGYVHSSLISECG